MTRVVFGDYDPGTRFAGGAAEVLMQENIGRTNRWIRAVVGSALVFAGIRNLRSGQLGPAALLTGGALLLESALTGVCPATHLLRASAINREEEAPGTQRLGEKPTSNGYLSESPLEQVVNEDIASVQRMPADS